MSAKAAEPEMAREFVEMLLSYNVMSMQQEPYPVNAASFDSLFRPAETGVSYAVASGGGIRNRFYRRRRRRFVQLVIEK